MLGGSSSIDGFLYICGRQPGGEGWACDAPTAMIAEKGTDMILGKRALARTAA